MSCPTPRSSSFAPTTEVRTILLGASNLWFPVAFSALSIPSAEDRLGQLVEERWAVLGKAGSPRDVGLMRGLGHLQEFSAFEDEAIWTAVQARRAAQAESATHGRIQLRSPEWEAFTRPDPARQSSEVRVPAFSVRVRGP